MSPRLAALLVAAIVSAPPAATEEARRVSFLPSRASFVSEDALVTYYVRVPIDARNRALVVVALDGDFAVRRSDQDLSAERRRTIWDVQWRLPVGELTLVAAVFDAGGEAGRDQRQVTVYATRP